MPPGEVASELLVPPQVVLNASVAGEQHGGRQKHHAADSQKYTAQDLSSKEESRQAVAKDIMWQELLGRGTCAQSWQRERATSPLRTSTRTVAFFLSRTSSGGSPLTTEIKKRTIGMVAGCVRQAVQLVQAGFCFAGRRDAR